MFGMNHKLQLKLFEGKYPGVLLEMVVNPGVISIMWCVLCVAYRLQLHHL